MEGLYPSTNKQRNDEKVWERPVLQDRTNVPPPYTNGATVNASCDLVYVGKKVNRSIIIVKKRVRYDSGRNSIDSVAIYLHWYWRNLQYADPAVKPFHC